MTATATKAPKAKSTASTTSSKKTSSKSKTSAAKLTSTSTSVRAKSGAATSAAPTVVGGQQPVVLGPQLRKKELVDSIVSQTGMKKKFVKPVVEATLAALGTALGENRELNLPPFGRMKVRKERELANGRVVVAKVRQTNPPADATAAQVAETKK